MLYQTKHVVVDAIQFSGADSVPAIQQFMAPQSPLFGPGRGQNGISLPGTLTVRVRDRVQDAQYPSLIPNYAEKTLSAGGWILRESDGELAVMTDSEFTARFERMDAPPVPEAPPLDRPIEITGVDMQPAAGDDPDPTTVVDTSHVQDRRG